MRGARRFVPGEALLLLLAPTLLLTTACGDVGARSEGPVVTDSAGVVLVSNPSETRPLTLEQMPDVVLGGKETPEESFYSVSRSSVATDDEGHIAVLDHDKHRVILFDSEGRHLRTMGREGEGPGEMQWPVAVMMDGQGRVLVRDLQKHGMVVFDGRTGEAGEPMALPANHSSGAIVPADSGFVLQTTDGTTGQDHVVHWSPDGEVVPIASAPRPEGSALDLESCGMRFSGMPPLFAPTLRWDAGSGYVAVVRGTGYRIDIFRDGELVRRIDRTVEPRPATLELAVEEIGEGMRVITTGGERICDSDEVAEQRGFGEVIPAIRALRMAPDGSLWVLRWAIGDEPAEIDLFDGEGAYQGTLPEGTGLPIGFLPDGRVLWSISDEFDVERLVIGRLEWRERGARDAARQGAPEGAAEGAPEGAAAEARP